MLPKHPEYPVAAPALRPVMALLAALASGCLLSAPSLAEVGDIYKVSGVQQDDRLNIRAQPNAQSASIASLPADAQRIITTGRQHQTGSSLWLEVRVETKPGQPTGWINSRYLSPQATAVFREPLQCGGTEPFWGLAIGQQAQFSTLDQSYPPMPADPAQRAENRLDTWSLLFHPAGSADPAFAFLTETQQCGDGMSDRLYRYQIQLRIRNRSYTGCCNPLP